MKFKSPGVLLFLMILSLISCATGPITNDRIQTIERGMDHEKFKSMISRDPVSTFGLQHKGISYTVEIYPMQIGTERQYDYCIRTIF